ARYVWCACFKFARKC
ncbi:hypothetical protein D039_3554B, partial [Vibrio parahaemolyticus EKP-028]